LERRKRLAALGEIAAGMAHEIRNPLGGIQLCASMLADDLREMPVSLELVGKISTGVKRLEALVSQVLHFTREIQARTAIADLAAVVDRAVELAWDRLGENAVRIIASGPRPMMAKVDSLLMEQAILNLLFNAIDAMNGKGEVQINWAANGDGGWKFSLRDSGPGIDPAIADRIFNPFFTTKDTGTGLGLAIVHRIVEAHDGTICVCNHPDGGAVFEIRVNET
jgi:two-component system sensor histidine kinase HydH